MRGSDLSGRSAVVVSPQINDSSSSSGIFIASAISVFVLRSAQSCRRIFCHTRDSSRSTPCGSLDRNPRFPSSMQMDLYCQSVSNRSVCSRYASAIADTRHLFFARMITSTVMNLGILALTSRAGIKKAEAKAFASRSAALEGCGPPCRCITRCPIS